MTLLCPHSLPAAIPCVLYFVAMGMTIIGWLALIFFPRRPWANFWFSGVAVPLALSIAHIYILLTFSLQPPPLNLLNFLTLDGVAFLFTNKGLLLAGWLDILAMSLVAGAWMARKAAQIHMPYIYLLPCLIATYVFAGIGFTMFAVVAAFGGGWSKIAKLEGIPPSDSEETSAMPNGSSATVVP
jgi:hypothetical protein